MFPPKFSEKQLGREDCSLGIEPNVQECVRLEANRAEESESIAIHLDNRLVAGDLLRPPATTRFEIALLDPVVIDRPASIDANFLTSRVSA